MSIQPIYLGVNIDHIATLRQARSTRFPDPVQAVLAAEEAGADGITLHLREDRRHIQERDVEMIRDVLQTRMNFEMAITPWMLDYVESIQPEHVCFVPEKREELTTEGGLAVIGFEDQIQVALKRMESMGADVSIFIDPNCEQIQAAYDLGAKTIEIHTGAYSDATNLATRSLELLRIEKAALYAHDLGMRVNAGHGLNYQNVKLIAKIDVFHELNIGHAIVCRALFTGFKQAVSDMRQLMWEGRYEGA